MKHRPASDAEKTLFRRTVARADPAVIPQSKPKKSGASAKAPGLDGHTASRLKRGAGQPEARLDLHGMTQTAAHRALYSFLLQANKSGFRLTLVITGKGNPKNEDAPFMASGHGVLKHMVPRWLAEPEFSALITGTAPAHLRHGGDGALYVYLRK